MSTVHGHAGPGCPPLSTGICPKPLSQDGLGVPEGAGAAWWGPSVSPCRFVFTSVFTLTRWADWLWCHQEDVGDTLCTTCGPVGLEVSPEVTVICAW